MSDDTSTARIVVFGLRGLLELAVLLAVAYWGYTAGTGLSRFGLAVGAPLVVIVVWGALGSPQAPRQLGEPYRGALSLVLFGTGAGALWAAGQPSLAVGFAAVAAVDTVAYYRLGGD